MNAFADVFARLDHEREKPHPEIRELIAQHEKPKQNDAVRDFMTEEGAAELLRRIAQFWDRKGKHNRSAVQFWIEKVNAPPYAGRNPDVIRCVRSNLVNGLPAKQ